MQGKKENMGKTEEGLYICGWILLLLGVLLWGASKSLPLKFSLPPCLFHLWTGWYCPGCGGTRAVRELLRGHTFKSFLYHPAVVYGAFLYLWFMLSHTLDRLSRGRCRLGLKYSDKYMYAALGIILIQCFLKNLGRLFWGWELT